jgi:nicotinamide riboside kinase
MSKLINLFGGAGIGKSSIANGITYKLKKKHISCNNPYEFPKRLAWDNNIPAISDQLYVFANQHRGIAECYGKVDYIVIDSPILFSTIYHRYYTQGYPANFYRESFHNLVIDLHNQYDSINILLERGETVHNDKERFQNYEEAVAIDSLCKQVLEENNVPYHTIKVGPKSVKKIIKLLGKSK